MTYYGSLRSREFCMGEYRDFESENCIIITTLLQLSIPLIK